MDLRALLLGFGLGAALTWVLDPENGRRRRTLARLRASDALADLGPLVQQRAEYVRERAEELVHEARARIEDLAVSDTVLVARVYAAIGRVVSNPRAIVITAHDGCVDLDGPIIASEAPVLLAAVRGVAGVQDIEDRLVRHEQPGATTGQGPSWNP